MTLEQLNSEVESFINDSYESSVSYRKERDDLREKVKVGLKGPVEVENILSERKSQDANRLKERSLEINAKIEKTREIEVKKIESKAESITADGLAELTLLSQLDVNSNELNKYIEKYKDTPLALRKLRAIAKENEIIANFPLDQAEQLDGILNKMGKAVTTFGVPNYQSYNVELSMQAEGTIDTLKRSVKNYRS